jgi:hypothetical protein
LKENLIYSFSITKPAPPTLSPGDIAGIVIGVVAIVVTIITAYVKWNTIKGWLRMRRPENKDEKIGV